jgi:hypothetical protein
MRVDGPQVTTPGTTIRLYHRWQLSMKSTPLRLATRMPTVQQTQAGVEATQTLVDVDGAQGQVMHK